MQRLLWILALVSTAALLPAQTTGGTGGAGGGTGGAGGGTGGVGGGTGGGSTGGGGAVGRTPNVTTPQQDPRQRMPEIPQTIYLQGKVMLEDGTPPPDPVTIERICNGTPRPEAYTDSRGRFSFQLGQNNGMFADASTPGAAGMGGMGGMGGGGGLGSSSPGGFGGLGGSGSGARLQLMGCELRASLPGYTSSNLSLSNRNSLDNPDVGTIILRRLGNREGNVFSATNAFAPKDAKKAMDKGRELVKKRKLDEAQKEFAKAVEAYPKFSSAWFELGKIQEGKGEIEDARKSFAQALAADPKFTPPYKNLFMLSVKEQKWDDVADTTARLLKLDPFDFPSAYYYNAVANFNLKKFDEAEKSAKSLFEKDPKTYARAGYLLGLVLAQKEDYTAAAGQLKKYLETVPDAPDRDLVSKQLTDIEKFARGNQD